MRIIIMTMVLLSVVALLLGCTATDPGLEPEKPPLEEPPVEDEDTGIGDVFDDDDDIKPPQIPE